ncbi:hypothetical protein, partial [Agromyces humatus]
PRQFSLTIARWLTNVYDEGDPAGNPTTPGDVTHNFGREPCGNLQRCYIRATLRDCGTRRHRRW